MGVVAFVISVKRDERQKEEEHLFSRTDSFAVSHFERDRQWSEKLIEQFCLRQEIRGSKKFEK